MDFLHGRNVLETFIPLTACVRVRGPSASILMALGSYTVSDAESQMPGALAPKARTVSAPGRLVAYEGAFVTFSPRQWAVLQALMEKQGGTVGREELLVRVWGRSRVTSRVVDASMSRVRAKLRAIGHPGIEARYRRGYRLLAAEEELRVDVLGPAGRAPEH